MKTERKNISQPADWWVAFERAAATRGESLSEWLGRVAMSNLTKGERRELSERPTLGRPKATATE